MAELHYETDYVVRRLVETPENFSYITRLEGVVSRWLPRDALLVRPTGGVSAYRATFGEKLPTDSLDLHIKNHPELAVPRLYIGSVRIEVNPLTHKRSVMARLYPDDTLLRPDVDSNHAVGERRISVGSLAIGTVDGEVSALGQFANALMMAGTRPIEFGKPESISIPNPTSNPGTDLK